MVGNEKVGDVDADEGIKIRSNRERWPRLRDWALVCAQASPRILAPIKAPTRNNRKGHIHHRTNTRFSHIGFTHL